MLDHKLTVKTVQSLTMTKQLQESLRVLQMNTFELKEYLDNQLIENPFMELSEGPYPNGDESLEDLRYESVQAKNDRHGFNEDYISKQMGSQVTLKRHLTEQIYIEINNFKERLIALRCTDLLDENGYLREDITEISSVLKCSAKEIESVLNKLKQLDPTGVYAQNLQECLELQLKEQSAFDDIYAFILSNLELVAKGEINKLIKNAGISGEEFKFRMETIKALNPKPGRNFFTDMSITLVPDAFVFFDSRSNLVVKLNNEHLPSINLNSDFYKETLENLKTKEEINFCKNKFHNAMFISRALEQRANGIFNVVNAIANIQYEFFEKGINYLKPMTLNDIAQATGLHESTISRICNKTISTTIGTFEIKFFFSSKLKSTFAENIYSSKSIKNMIKELIEGEQPRNILADDKIAELLQARGIEISRRTVTKYRESMQLPSSHERKRLKNIAS